jgi:hypothetical protein
MPGEMIEAARTGDQGLLRREPVMHPDALGDLLSAFDIRILYIDRTHA